MDEPKEEKIQPLEAADQNEEIHEERYKHNHEKCNECLPYDILRILFGYLNATDLSNARVCISWLEAVNDEKRSRGPLCFIENYRYVLRGRWNFIKQLKIKPCVGLFFLPSSEYVYLDSIRDTIVLNNDKINIRQSLTKAYAFLPQIRNVNIRMIEITETCLLELKEYRKMILASKNDHGTSMCLMLFISNNDLIRCTKKTAIGSKMATCAQLRLGNNEKIVSVCGGYIEKLQTNVIDCSWELYGVALSITGEVKTWSIVLKDETRELIEKKLKTFKEQVELQRHSVGFWFSSKNQASNMQDAELAIFKKLFPKLPLVGCRCRGCYVFGKDITRELDQTTSESWINIYSTTFMILTYGQLPPPV